MTSNLPNLTPQPGGEKTKPAPKARPKPKPKSFLFINKDPESEVLSRSSGHVAASINSHVQRWHDKKVGRSKAQSKSHASQQASSKAPAYRDCVTKFRRKSRKRPEREPSSQRSPFEREHSDSSSSGPRTAYSTTPESVDALSEGDATVELISHDLSRPRREAIPRANFSGADCIDPFQSTYAHSPGVQPILQYYITFTLASTFEGDSKAKGLQKEPPHFPAIRNIVRGTLSQPMHMYALLAATAARMKRVSGIRFPRESSPELLLHNAIRSMREYFASCNGPLTPDDRQVVLDIFYLCVCEWYEKKYDAARTHLAFVRHFWSSLRPLDSVFDKYIHDMITYNDVFLAIATGGPPLFSLTWEPAPLPAGRIQEIEEGTSRLSISSGQHPLSASTSSKSLLLASTVAKYSTNPNPLSMVATGFAALTANNSPRLPLELIHILMDLVPLIRTAYYHIYIQKSHPPTEAEWVSLKTQALLHKLLSLNCHYHTLASSISLSIIILLSCMSTSAAWRTGKVDMPELARRLSSMLSLQPWQNSRYPIVVDNIHYEETTSPALSPSLAGIDDSLLLWILVSGAYAAQTDIQEEQWFFVQAVQCTKRMGIYDATTLKMELRRYLYLEELETATLDRLCAAMRLSWNGSIDGVDARLPG